MIAFLLRQHALEAVRSSGDDGLNFYNDLKVCLEEVNSIQEDMAGLRQVYGELKGRGVFGPEFDEITDRISRVNQVLCALLNDAAGPGVSKVFAQYAFEMGTIETTPVKRMNCAAIAMLETVGALIKGINGIPIDGLIATRKAVT